MKKTLITLITLIAASFAMANEPMLHVEFTENSSGGEPTQIKVNLPLNMLSAMGDQFQSTLDEIDLDGQEINLREIWNEVKNAGPNEYVNIQSDEGTVSVSTNGTEITINVEEDDQQIQVVIPYAVAEALLGGDEPNLEELIEALSQIEGDLLTITGTDVNGRIWID